MVRGEVSTDDAVPLLDGHGLVGRRSPGNVSTCPSGQVTSIGCHPRSTVAEPEGQRQLALRQVARAGLDDLPQRVAPLVAA